MVKLHGLIWVGLAIFIFAYTLFIERQVEKGLPAFKYIAVLCLLWGAWRLTNDYMKRNMKRKEAKPEPAGPPQRMAPEHAFHGSPHGNSHISQTHEHIRETHAHLKHPSMHPSHTAAQQGQKRCPHCHQLQPRQSRFCSNCGYRFF